MSNTKNKVASASAVVEYPKGFVRDPATTAVARVGFGVAVEPIFAEVEVGVATVAVGEPIRAIPVSSDSGAGVAGAVYVVDTEWSRTPGANAQLSHGLRGIVTEILSVDLVDTSARVIVQLQGCVEAGLTTGVAAGDALTFDTAGVLSLATVGQPIWAYALEAEASNSGKVLMFPTPIGTQLA